MTRLALVLAAVLAAACQTAPPPEPQGAPAVEAMPIDEVARRIEEYWGKNVSPGIGLTAADIGPSDIPGWNQGTLEVDADGNDQSIPFLVSPDGRYFISGEVTDLTVDPLETTMAKIDLEGRPARGPTDATVTIVEYSDFQCPFCRRGYEIVEQEVLAAYDGQVRFYFKHLPLKSIHPWAERAHAATECAEQQDPEAFWDLYHAIFKHQAEIHQDNLREKLTGFATEAGLDEEAFVDCLLSDGGLAQVERDLEEATALGANATPTFFINGRRLEGAQPLENFKAIIDAELG